MYAISSELLQLILNYLANQPYAQVAGLIAQIQQCQPVANTEHATVEADD